MQRRYGRSELKSIVKNLVDEVSCGLHIKDTLPNSALKFDKEAQALYFSNMRKHMETILAHTIMTENQSISDIKIIGVLKRDEQF